MTLVLNEMVGEYFFTTLLINELWRYNFPVASLPSSITGKEGYRKIRRYF